MYLPIVADQQSLNLTRESAKGVAYAGCVAENVAMDLVDALVVLPQSPVFAPLLAFVLQVEGVRDSLLAVETFLVDLLPPLGGVEAAA